MSENPKHTPGLDYAREAYRACLYGRADERQQQSAAAQISSLHGIKGELVTALQLCKQGAEYPDELGDIIDAVLAKTLGEPSP